MSDRGAVKSHKYLYAIVAGMEDRTYRCCGIDGASVYIIPDGEVAAVVSDVPSGKIRPERRHLAVHQEVLKRLMQETTPLPTSFGTIADDPKAIQKILSSNREAFLQQLRRVEGKVEMGLRVNWDVPDIFEYFVHTHPKLRLARDRFLGPHRLPSQGDKIEVGRLFDRVLNEDREACTERVESILSGYCFEIKRNRCRNEREVMNLACLVGREAQERFEAGVLEAAKLFDNHFAFDYSGPWAPYSFVELELAV
jgi:hypothetical protein